ncbi:S26 family signal peptidase [Virgisporangium aurantiacum]|uniref:S26 family signal peptidase n=1 Tax=Virgisporangium aurantiacum TaxID=175570 RepID=A0A8J3ZG03_9ACTN|nr:S26 family signal peptidase [Virgisporangium aurantiacum]GIJ62197.1 S26 family signal peptidase [Virgisporangium aurantiacum]
MGWVVGIVLVVVAIIAGVARWARRSLVLVTVDGSSMEPSLYPGDRVLIRRRGLARVRRGDIVVLEPPADGFELTGIAQRSLDGRRWNVKRAVALPGDPVPPAVQNAVDADRVPPDALVVIGDSPASIDSRQRGFFSANDLLGVVVRRISRADVTGTTAIRDHDNR